MLYGIAPVIECLRAGRRHCQRLYIKEGKPGPQLQEIVQLARQRRLQVEEASVQTLANLAQDRHHQGAVLQCGDLPTHDLRDFLASAGYEASCIVALDQIQDPQNLGAIIRTAAFLGASAVLTLRHGSAPLSAAVSKASAGALERFPVIQAANLSDSLLRCRDEGYTVIGTALSDEAVDFRGIARPERLVLVLGSEGEGMRSLSQKRCEFIVKIPGRPGTQSLNVNASAAILLQHFVGERIQPCKA